MTKLERILLESPEDEVRDVGLEDEKGELWAWPAEVAGPGVKIDYRWMDVDDCRALHAWLGEMLKEVP